MKNIVLAITESGDEDIFLLPPHLSLPPFSLIEVEGKEGKKKEKAKTIRKSIEVTEEVVSYVSSSPSPRRFLSILPSTEEKRKRKRNKEKIKRSIPEGMVFLFPFLFLFLLKKKKRAEENNSHYFSLSFPFYLSP